MRMRHLAALVAAAGLSACQPADAPSASEDPGATAAGLSTGSSTPSASTETARDAAPASNTPTAVSEVTDDATPGDATPGDDCGASKVSARWLNALPTADVKAAIAKAVGDRPIRYYGQGDPITMDFSPQRLNVELGKDGRIKLFRCG
jgi:hypothetical protein